MTLPCTTVELRVYDRDGVTLRDTIGAVGMQFTDPLGTIGSANLSVPLLQAVIASDPALLTNAIIKVATNLTAAGPLVEVFGFLAEGGDLTLIGAQEDADKARSLQCRGLLGLVDDWIVYPESGVKAYGGDKRIFGWMSGESSHWFDQSQWSGTIRGIKWRDVAPTADRYRLPKRWPDPHASWIDAGNAREKQYLRTTVTVTAPTRVRLYVSADEKLRVYHNSELIIRNGAREIGYTELCHWRGILDAGTHTFGVYFTKEPSHAGDMDRVIFSLCALRLNGTIDRVLRRSSTGSRWLGVGINDGVRPPTWTAAGIVGKLYAEARARVVQSAQRTSLGFTDSHDSDGTAFPDLHERSWPVGTNGGKVLTDLGEHDIDFDMLPDLTLNAYVNQGSNVSATVALTKGVNILGYKCGNTPLIANSLLVRTGARWLERSDAGSLAANDRREQLLELGGAVSREQGRNHADRALDDFARDRFTYTAEIVAVAGCVPYLDFGKGDTVMAYDTTLTATPMRVVSISGSTPDDGPIRWTLELEER